MSQENTIAAAWAALLKAKPNLNPDPRGSDRMIFLKGVRAGISILQSADEHRDPADSVRAVRALTHELNALNHENSHR